MRYVYVVEVPEDTGLDGIYGTASKAIARLKEYGGVKMGAVRDLQAGKIVYVQYEDGEGQTHAHRSPVL